MKRTKNKYKIKSRPFFISCLIDIITGVIIGVSVVGFTAQISRLNFGLDTVDKKLTEQQKFVKTLENNSVDYEVDKSTGDILFHLSHAYFQASTDSSYTYLKLSYFDTVDDSLTEYTLPESLYGLKLEAIGTSAFANNNVLKKIVFNKNLRSIGVRAFQNCLSLESVDFSTAGDLSIGDSAFMNCNSLKNVVLTSNVKSVGNQAFFSKSIESVKIIGDINFTGNSAFSNLSNLKSVDLSECTRFSSGLYFLGCSSLTDIIMSDYIVSLGPSFFRYCSSLEYISIPESVTTIGLSCFEDCNKLKELYIPDNVTTIGNDAFKRCFALTSLSLPARFKDSIDLANIGITDSSIVTYRE